MEAQDGKWKRETENGNAKWKPAGWHLSATVKRPSALKCYLRLKASERAWLFDHLQIEKQSHAP